MTTRKETIKQHAVNCRIARPRCCGMVFCIEPEQTGNENRLELSRPTDLCNGGWW